MFNDFVSRAIGRLKDKSVREVALLRLEGHSNPEISSRLDVSLSTVERKVRVIRTLWTEEFATEP